VAPIDLRVDHVYLISCKYLSKILFNVSPTHVFDALLAGPRRAGRTQGDAAGVGGDWFAEVAPAHHQELYAFVRAAAQNRDTHNDGGARSRSSGGEEATRARTVSPSPGRGGTGTLTLPGLGESPPDAGRMPRPADERREPGTPPDVLRDLPERAVNLTSLQREALGRWLRSGWPAGAKERYGALADAVARNSARRWQDALAGGTAAEAMVWRLLRIGGAPYFVLGSSDSRSLRLRIDTPWDWRQQYRLVSLDVAPQAGGQARVGWEATVRHRAANTDVTVAGHIEVRWSHGRFAGPPEAKGYLDTPHHLVPGYVALR
jgi:hypothetical protein